MFSLLILLIHNVFYNHGGAGDSLAKAAVSHPLNLRFQFLLAVILIIAFVSNLILETQNKYGGQIC